MSLPSTGCVIARVDSFQFTFDGITWTGDMPVFVSCLNTLTPHWTGTHITAVEAARDILNDMFGDDFEILYAKSDTWKTELPPGAID